jgi:hypothetical protein
VAVTPDGSFINYPGISSERMSGTSDERYDPSPARTVNRVPIRPEESVVEAILHGFRTTDGAVVPEGAVLADQVPPDALRDLVATADSDVVVRLTLWGREVVVTPEAVRVGTH